LQLLCQCSKPVTLGGFHKLPDSNNENIKILIDNMAKSKSDRTVIIEDFNFSDIT